MMGNSAAAKSSLKDLDKAIFKRLMLFIIKGNKFKMVIIIIGLVITSVTSAISALFLRTLIDDYITPLIGQTNPSFIPLINLLFIMGGVYLISIIANFMSNRLITKISMSKIEEIRNDLFDHMQDLPIKYFDVNAHGDILSIYTNDVDTLLQLVSSSIPTFITSLISVVSIATSMLFLNIWLTLISFFMIFVTQQVMMLIMKKGGKYFVLKQQQVGKTTGFIEEMVSASRVIKTFTKEEEVLSEFEKLNNELFINDYNANKITNITMPIVMNLGNLSFVFTAFIGGVLAIMYPHLISVGVIASFLTLNKSISMPISNVAQQMNAILLAMAGAKRIYNLLDEEVEVDNGHIKLTYVCDSENGLQVCDDNKGVLAWDNNGELSLVKGNIVFDHVNFSYVEDKPILKDICVYVSAGEKIAFVGATGAGKTTIMNLINRFYEIEDGLITYDGFNIKDIRKSSLRKAIGIVLQDTHLFSGTIMDNICYGSDDYDEKKVKAASRLANAHQFIKHLKDGYNTVISDDGESLSVGQRQLIAIARSAMANSMALVLDEATSSIDSNTEKIVQDGMDKLMNNRSVFVIAHRLSTIKNSDVIMVLDHGKIIERGNHQDLIKNKGIYYQLYTGKIEID
ncbi:MAG: ABC transporter ATP-binding protein [Erysipelotrichaceae bacterium]